jgi:AraC-like DNA-binding protein
MKKSTPVYAIHDFNEIWGEGNCYANDVKDHVASHHFTNLPHKHDFYLVILFTRGSGTHEIDFESYHVKPGALFILKPGQMHYWKLTGVDGYVFFHTGEFYNEGYTQEKVTDYPFMNSFQYQPYFLLKDKELKVVEGYMRSVMNEYKGKASLKYRKIRSLINLCYIEISRIASPVKSAKNETYLGKLREFEALLEKQFKTEKSAAKYASMLNISEKHLNRIVKTCLNKTTTQLIAERVILEVRRMLVQGIYNIEQIGTELGYYDKSYFSRFFRKNTRMSPTVFLNNYIKSEK